MSIPGKDYVHSLGIDWFKLDAPAKALAARAEATIAEMEQTIQRQGFNNLELSMKVQKLVKDAA